MVAIKKSGVSSALSPLRNHGSLLKYSLAMTIGIAIGIAIGRTQGDLHIAPATSNKNDNAKEIVIKSDIAQDGSFHPIHVYRGNTENIKYLPKQMSELTLNYNIGSQVDQDKVISSLVDTYRSKHSNAALNSGSANYFIDLAANDAIQLSNTLHLESQGWEGLCVEPNPVYWYRLAHRKCAVAGAFVGGKSDMQEITVSFTQEYGGIVGKDFDNSEKKETDEKRFSVSLRTIFSTFHVPTNIQYLSLDVEGAEELIMKDFPFDKYVISFITIERPRPALKDLLESNGYKFVTILIYWGETLWVHESIIQDGFSMEEILKTAKANSKFIDQKPKRGAEIFDMETGEWKIP